MGKQIKEIYRKAESSFNNPASQKKWQGGIGIVVMTLFVLSSVVFNDSLQAANQVAGSYGYYGGTHGYNASTTSSDAAPAAPSALAIGTLTTTTADLSWTAPTLTTTGTAIATGSGSIASYVVRHGSASFSSSCSSETSVATPTSASTTLSNSSFSGTEYFCLTAVDNNGNETPDGSAHYFSVAFPVTSSSSTGVSAGGSSGTAGSVSGGTAVAVTGATGTGSLGVTGATGTGSLGVVAALGSVSTSNLTSIASLASVANVAESAVQAKATVVTNALASTGLDAKLSGDAETYVKNIIATVAASNPFYATTARVDSFVGTLNRQVSGTAFSQMNADSNKAAFFARTYVATVMNGNDYVRSEARRVEFPQLNTDIEAAERAALGQARIIATASNINPENTAKPGDRTMFFEWVRRFANKVPPPAAVKLDAEANAAFAVASAFRDTDAGWKNVERLAGKQLKTVAEIGVGQNTFASAAARAEAKKYYADVLTKFVSAIAYSPSESEFAGGVKAGCYDGRGCTGAFLGNKTRNECKAAVQGSGSWGSSSGECNNL